MPDVDSIVSNSYFQSDFEVLLRNMSNGLPDPRPDWLKPKPSRIARSFLSTIRAERPDRWLAASSAVQRTPSVSQHWAEDWAGNARTRIGRTSPIIESDGQLTVVLTGVDRPLDDLFKVRSIRDAAERPTFTWLVLRTVLSARILWATGPDEPVLPSRL